MPSLVAMFSLILGGYISDSFIKKGYKVINVRKTVNSIGFFGSAIFLYLILCKILYSMQFFYYV